MIRTQTDGWALRHFFKMARAAKADALGAVAEEGLLTLVAIHRDAHFEPGAGVAFLRILDEGITAHPMQVLVSGLGGSAMPKRKKGGDRELVDIAVGTSRKQPSLRVGTAKWEGLDAAGLPEGRAMRAAPRTVARSDLRLGKDDLGRIAEDVAAVAHDGSDYRWNLTCVHLARGGATATDGHRLHHLRLAALKGLDPSMVPAPALLAVHAALKDVRDGEVGAWVAAATEKDGWCGVEAEGGPGLAFEARDPDAFPDWRGTIMKPARGRRTWRMRVDAAKVREAAGRKAMEEAEILLKRDGVEARVVLDSTPHGQPDVTETRPLGGSWDGPELLPLSLRLRYLRDAVLGAATDGTVAVEVHSNQDFVLVDEPPFLAIVMPALAFDAGRRKWSVASVEGGVEVVRGQRRVFKARPERRRPSP